jgi:hypothetical protein
MTNAPSVDAAQTIALTALVQLEHAVCYGLAAGGGKLAVLGGSAAAVAATRQAFDLHRLRRDQLVATLTAQKAPAPPAAPAYSLPALGSRADALHFLAGLAQSSARAYRDQLVALASQDLRRVAVVAVVDDARYGAHMLEAAGASTQTATSALPGSD